MSANKYVRYLRLLEDSFMEQAYNNNGNADEVAYGMDAVTVACKEAAEVFKAVVEALEDSTELLRAVTDCEANEYGCLDTQIADNEAALKKAEGE